VFKIASIDQFHRWVEAQAMFSKAFVPDEKTGNDGGICPQCEESDRRRRCRRNSKEVCEDAFLSRRVLIEKDSDGLVLPEGFQNVACSASALDGDIATRRTVIRNELLDSRIVNRPDDEFKRVAVNGVRKGTQLPRAEMCGHENDPAASAQTFEIVFESIVNDEPPNVPFVQFPEVRELDEQAPEVLKTSSQNSFSFVVAQLRKCDPKISHARAPQPACEMETKPSQDFGGSVCDVAWHHAKGPDNQQCDSVFGDSFNTSAHP